MISPGATSTAFSGLDDYFFRTIPPDTVQGVVMGDLIAQDGIKNLATAVFNDEYGISLRAEVLKTLKEGGVNVVYGETETFDPAENNFSSIATNIKATNPDAVLVIAADQTIPPVKELAAKGIDTHKLYMPDSNMVDHSEDFTSGLLKGSKGTIPGAHPTSEFQNALKTIAPDTTIYTYNTETYDAMVLAAFLRGRQRDGAEEPHGRFGYHQRREMRILRRLRGPDEERQGNSVRGQDLNRRLQQRPRPEHRIDWHL